MWALAEVIGKKDNVSANSAPLDILLPKHAFDPFIKALLETKSPKPHIHVLSGLNSETTKLLTESRR